MCVMGGRGCLCLRVLGAELASQRCFQMFCWVYFIFYFFFPSWCEATGSLPWLVQREQMCAVIRIITLKKPFSLPKSFPQEQGTQRAATRRGASFPGEMEPGGFGGSWGSTHGPCWLSSTQPHLGPRRAVGWALPSSVRCVVKSPLLDRTVHGTKSFTWLQGLGGFHGVTAMGTGTAAAVCAAAAPELLLRGSAGEVPMRWEGKAGIAQLGHEGSALSKLLQLKGSQPPGDTAQRAPAVPSQPRGWIQHTRTLF